MRVALLVLCVVGFVFSIPNLLCISAAAGLVGAATDVISSAGSAMGIEGASEVRSFGAILQGKATIIFVVCIVAFILGIIAFTKPRSTVAIIAGILLLISGGLQLLLIAYGYSFSTVFGSVAGVCLLLSGLFAFIAKPDVAAPAAPSATAS